MSSIERGFVPITEAQSDHLRINLDLPPFIEKDKIGVNLRDIHLLCQIGGIKHLWVVGIEGDEASNSAPTIVGFDSQGNAYAGKTGAKADASIQQAESRQETGVDSQHHSMVWANTNIAINIDEVANRISSDKRWNDGLRSANAWSHYLNKGLKEGLSSEGTFHLVLRLSTKNKATTGVFTSLALLYSAGIRLFDIDPHIPQPVDAVQDYFALSLMWNLINRAFEGESPKFSDKSTRYSLFYGPELDRALLLNLITKTKRLIKTIEGSK